MTFSEIWKDFILKFILGQTKNGAQISESTIIFFNWIYGRKRTVFSIKEKITKTIQKKR